MIPNVLNKWNANIESNKISIVEAAFKLVVLNTLMHIFYARPIQDYVLFIHSFGAVLCVLILTAELWPQKYKQYQNLYWFFTLLICIPVAYITELISSSFEFDVLLRVVFALFILSLLVNFIAFLYIITSGFLLSIFILYIFDHSAILEFFHSIQAYKVLLLIIVFSVIANSFLKQSQKNYDKRFQIARSIAGILSHEIRTPLATLKMHIKKLEADIAFTPNMGAIQERLKIMSYLEQEISGFIDGTLIKLQDDRAIIFDNVDLKSEITSTIAHFRNQTEIKIPINIDLKRNFTFQGDSVLFRHVIFNLLKNSMYCLKVKPATEISIFSTSTKDSNVLVFEDSGVGIKKEDLDQIFDSFYTTKKSGSGLGLYYCKSVIEKFGGYITCESKKNEYTRFKIFLPKIRS